MEFRRANESDFNCIMNIIRQAQNYFKEQGIDQWQNNYPNLDTIRNDISNKSGYVLLRDNNVIGTGAVFFDGEKTYNRIYNGRWISNNEYSVIHRMAIDSRYKGLGLATLFIENIVKISLSKGIHSIRVDTHEENMPMQRLLQKNEFEYCGVIYLEDGSKRIAFEKISK